MEALVRTDEGAVAVWSNDVFDILRGQAKNMTGIIAFPLGD
jgi:hypothetical protein